MKNSLYRKIFKALNEDLNTILSDDDFEEPEIDLGVHIQNIQTKYSPLYIIQDAINNNDQEKLRKLINNLWDGKTALYTVNHDNIKTIIEFSIEALGNEADLNWIDTSNVTDMSWMFYNSTFNGDISEWDVSSVTNMPWMFADSNFNGDISRWDVSSVENMSDMFSNSVFNRDIGTWDVSSVINMHKMFFYSKFNQPIGSWDVSNVKNMEKMFAHSEFQLDISAWQIAPDASTLMAFVSVINSPSKI